MRRAVPREARGRLPLQATAPTVLALAMVPMLLHGATARGNGAPAVARHSVEYTSLTAAQLNPLGVQTDLGLGYRYRLFSSPSLLLSDTYAGGLLVARVNPAFARLGGGLEIQPLAVIALRLLYEHHLYFGSANMIQSFASPTEEHSDQMLKHRGAAGASYSTHGHQVTLQAVLRAKVGPVAVFNEMNAIYHRMYLKGQDRFFYVNYFDLLAPADGFVLLNNAHLVLLWRNWILGFRHTLVHAVYPGNWSDAAELHPTNHRLGPIFSVTFPDVSPRLRRPTLILIVNWWFENPYRSGSVYGVLALQFSGDVLSW
jgi:hypothetical protein